jgi:hypothetical protein
VRNFQDKPIEEEKLHDYEVATFIPLGYPKKEPRVRQIKVNLEERIHIDIW